MSNTRKQAGQITQMKQMGDANYTPTHTIRGRFAIAIKDAMNAS